MERLTKTYSDGTHGASDSLPCGDCISRADALRVSKNEYLKHYMYHLQGYNVLRMEILKSLVKVLEQQLLMVGMSGKRVLPESQLLNGYKGVTENDNRKCNEIIKVFPKKLYELFRRVHTL